MSAAQQVYYRGASGTPIWPLSLLKFDPNMLAKPSSNTDAVVTVDADSKVKNVLLAIYASYSANPAAGSLVKVEDGSGNIVFEQYISVANPPPIIFDPPLANAVANTLLKITLTAGGSGISGALYCSTYKEQ